MAQSQQSTATSLWLEKNQQFPDICVEFFAVAGLNWGCCNHWATVFDHTMAKYIATSLRQIGKALQITGDLQHIEINAKDRNSGHLFATSDSTQLLVFCLYSYIKTRLLSTCVISQLDCCPERTRWVFVEDFWISVSNLAELEFKLATDSRQMATDSWFLPIYDS